MAGLKPVLPSSGAISMSDIRKILGMSSTDAISLNDVAVRNLAGIPSGPISLSDFYGKAPIAVIKSDIGTISTGYASGTTVDVHMTFMIEDTGNWKIYITQGALDIQNNYGGYVYSGTWVEGAAPTDGQFEVMFEMVSDSLNGNNNVTITNGAPDWMLLGSSSNAYVLYTVSLASSSNLSLTDRNIFNVKLISSNDSLNVHTTQVIFDLEAMVNNNG